jgi:hypothetical protein
MRVFVVDFDFDLDQRSLFTLNGAIHLCRSMSSNRFVGFRQYPPVERTLKASSSSFDLRSTAVLGEKRNRREKSISIMLSCTLSIRLNVCFSVGRRRHDNKPPYSTHHNRLKSACRIFLFFVPSSIVFHSHLLFQISSFHLIGFTVNFSCEIIYLPLSLSLSLSILLLFQPASSLTHFEPLSKSATLHSNDFAHLRLQIVMSHLLLTNFRFPLHQPA